MRAKSGHRQSHFSLTAAHNLTQTQSACEACRWEVTPVELNRDHPREVDYSSAPLSRALPWPHCKDGSVAPGEKPCCWQADSFIHCKSKSRHVIWYEKGSLQREGVAWKVKLCSHGIVPQLCNYVKYSLEGLVLIIWWLKLLTGAETWLTLRQCMLKFPCSIHTRALVKPYTSLWHSYSHLASQSCVKWKSLSLMTHFRSPCHTSFRSWENANASVGPCLIIQHTNFHCYQKASYSSDKCPLQTTDFTQK